MRFTIKLKLALAFAAIIVLMIGATTFGIMKLGKINSDQTAMIHGPAQRLENAQELSVTLLQILRAEKNMAMTNDPALNARDNAKAEAEKRRFAEVLQHSETIASGEDKPSWQALRAAWDEFVPMDSEIRQLALANRNQEATSIMLGRQRDVNEAITRQTDHLVEVSKAQLAAADAQGNTDYVVARNTLIAILATCFLIAAGAAVWLSLTISRGLKKISDLTEAVAIGDLHQTITVTTNDEIKDLVENVNRMTANLRATAALADSVADGDLTVQPKPLSDKDTLGLALQRMVERLRGVVANALSASDQVSSGSQELSAAAEQVSQGATEQAASVEEASASMEQMASNIRQNADNASQTEQIARQSAKDAEVSGAAVSRAVDAMQTIAEKITIVQEIARQTDLLALNAAVEAARAGEHGKGFAVVASEVRKLAERSQTAATEIGSVSSETVRAAQSAGEMLTKLVPDIRRTSELVSEISAACREQDIGASQVNEALQQLDKITQANSSASEQMASTSEELAAQAEELQVSIAFFRTDATGRTSAPAAVAVRPVAQSRPAPARARTAGKGVKAQQAAAKGFALDLAQGGPDDQDQAFREYA
jgi:methyl-accepting chemotaxis protein